MRVLSAAVALATALSTITAGPHTAGAAPDASVDLRLTAANLELPPETSAPQTLTVTNLGSRATTAPSRLVYVSPTYINFEAPLPAGCEYRYQNPDPLVSEIVECSVPAGLQPNAAHEVTFTMSATTTNLVGTSYGSALVSPDVTVDPDAGFSDNATVPDATLRPEAPPTITEYTANVYLGYTVPSLAPGATGLQHFTFGNQGPDETRDPVRLVYTTPFFVNLAAGELPEGCERLFPSPDPLVPEVVQCLRPVTGVGVPSEQTVSLNLTALKGGPSGTVYGPAVASEAPVGSASAHDPSVIDNVQIVGVNELP